MELTKATLAGYTRAGWIPKANTLYLTLSSPAYLYIPLPDIISGMGVICLHPGTLFDALLASDQIHLEDTPLAPEDAGDITICFIRPYAPYVVSIQAYGKSPVILTLREAMDTASHIDVESLPINYNNLCRNRYQFLLSRLPAYSWNFGVQYIEDDIPVWYDEVTFTKMVVPTATVAYPSSFMEASLYGIFVPADSEDIVVDIDLSKSTSFGAFVWYSGGDGIILSLDVVTLRVDSGILSIWLDDIQYTTIQSVEVGYSGTSIQPGYEIGFLMTGTQLFLYYEREILGVYAVPTTMTFTLAAQSALTLPTKVEACQYSGLMVFNQPINAEDLLCNPVEIAEADYSGLVKVGGRHCTNYTTAVWGFDAGADHTWLPITSPSVRGYCTLLISSVDEAILTLQTVNGLQKTPLYSRITLLPGEIRRYQIHLREDETIEYSIIQGSPVAHIIQIEEH